MVMNVVPGPTYAEMRDPLLLPSELRAAAQAALGDELNPLNLFNINWKNTDASVEKIVLPRGDRRRRQYCGVERSELSEREYEGRTGLRDAGGG